MARKDDDDGSRTGAMTGSTLWWVAGGLILLVLIGLVWVLINVGKSSPAAVATHTVTAPATSPSGAGAPPTTPASSATTTGNASGCNVPGGNALVPTAAIPATWQLVGSYAVPVSPTVGPKTITGPGGKLRSCYQHSPAGAVVAAMNIALASATPNNHQVLEQGYTPGPGLVEAEQLPADGSNASIAGFLTQACTQSSCLVKIALTVQNQDIEGTMPMIWSSGDWKVNGQVTGVAKGVAITSLSPYIPMSASNTGPTS